MRWIQNLILSAGDPKKAEEYKKKVMRVLFSREVYNINFKAYGVTIHGGIFPKIAYDIANEKRFVKINSSFDPGGAAARYYPDQNMLDIPDDDNSVHWKGYVIHEAVHAWVDRSKLNILAVHDEGLAYIAHTLYLRQHNLVAFESGHYQTAAKIATDISQGKTPDIKDLSLLAIRIINRPVYFHLTPDSKYNADG